MLDVSILPMLTGIQLVEVIPRDTEIIAVATTTAYAARCPACHQLSRHVHSRYVRTLADLPVGRKAVRMVLHSRRFFCDTPRCAQAIFTERIPGLTVAYSRRTQSLAETLTQIALAVGGEGGARLTVTLRMGTSADALLRLLRRAEVPVVASPRVIGVDDWAYRKGQRYGTLVVDLERHRAIDLLPERTTESWAEWLRIHPTVEVVSRDRGDTYATGTTLGAPHARQVADRWHLHHNLIEAVQHVVERQHGKLRAIAKVHTGAAIQAIITAARDPSRSSKLYKTETTEERHRQDLDRRYRERYEDVHRLLRQGLSISAVAKHLGLNRRTITTLLAAETYPGIPTRGQTPRAVAGFEGYVRRRWAEGVRNITALLAEIRAQGYPGAYSSLWHFVRTLTAGEAGMPTASPSAPSSTPSPRAATWWLFGKTERLTTEQQHWLQQWLADCPQVDTTRRLALQFVDTLRAHQVETFRQWLTDVERCEVVELRRFAASLRSDMAAVEAGIADVWNNGMVEGHVNRLKLLKRQMYGRAKFDLLRIRVLNPV